MTGILIFTAGREDAFEDYKQSVRDGHRISELEPHLPEQELETIADYYEDDIAHLWGTSAEAKWRKVEQGDVALIYRDGSYIARATVVHCTENIQMARELWDTERNPWDETNPWKYLTFVTDVEAIDVDAEAFNNLVGYDQTYRPQGFTRVADHRVEQLKEERESVETALAELTGKGEKKRTVDWEDRPTSEIAEELIETSKDGDQSEKFEKLVAEAFSRLGFQSQWVEGGGDTDVEVTAPIHAIVEAKARSGSRGVSDLNASTIATHRDQRGADYGFVVGRHFPPQAIQNANRNELTTISSEVLAELLEKRARYGIPPEAMMEILGEPGAVQDDRLDDLNEIIRSRVGALEAAFAVIEALAVADEGKTASQIRHILMGMRSGEYRLTSSEIERALQFLSYPGVDLLAETEEGFVLRTDFENAVETLESLDAVIEKAIERY